MFSFTPNATQPKPALYQDLVLAAQALTSGEDDVTANMANLAALLWQFLPGLNWAGFYRLHGRELVLH